MRTTRQMSITLPTAMADAVRSRVESGDFASESEVVREGLRALLARDRAVEEWLRDEVVTTYDEMRRDPESGLTAAEIRSELARRLPPR
ncbi:type II toxin-antitoxin system ParD family antitoxin [Clavibacter sp. VKM Ac-2873]|uniref:ribbon-helix-helix domain-containing protein n=1 Tax=Clavibacter sp. VKM Ac-2873 TaxID=2783813 RepID=UPI00188D953A|nr:type II toxin-antitoxin system ParD family antitoxin [Clavibacter sp. VKM Ac-2873]MBF4618045.1 type II toxin-antitoxin system ParD family antitoxin [Clavibacter sp. VKM Ac-2873]